MENKEEKKLLTVKDLCAYLSIGETKARELLHNPDNGSNRKPIICSQG